jgi:hypothetical protein
MIIESNGGALYLDLGPHAGKTRLRANVYLTQEEWRSVLAGGGESAFEAFLREAADEEPDWEEETGLAAELRLRKEGKLR